MALHPEPFQRGDFVFVTADGVTLRAMVAVASPNGRAIIVMYEGMLGGFVGACPAFIDEAGQWAALNGMPLAITRATDFTPE